MCSGTTSWRGTALCLRELHICTLSWALTLVRYQEKNKWNSIYRTGVKKDHKYSELINTRLEPFWEAFTTYIKLNPRGGLSQRKHGGEAPWYIVFGGSFDNLFWERCTFVSIESITYSRALPRSRLSDNVTMCWEKFNKIVTILLTSITWGGRHSASATIYLKLAGGGGGGQRQICQLWDFGCSTDKVDGQSGQFFYESKIWYKFSKHL